MATNRMSGNLLGLEIDGTFVSCETSCELSFETDLLPASATMSGRWKEFISGTRSWSVSVNAGMLIRMSGTGLNTILNAFITGERMSIKIKTKFQDSIPSFAIVGYVRLRNGGLNASVNSLANWNATLDGDGPFNAEINENVVYAISTVLDDTEVLEDGNGSLIVSNNDESEISYLSNEKYGTFEVNDIGQSSILIPHGLNEIPSYFTVDPINEQAINNSYSEITADALNLIITPIIMLNNSQLLRYIWLARV